jgi:hypothetical protein
MTAPIISQYTNIATLGITAPLLLGDERGGLVLHLADRFCRITTRPVSLHNR